MFWYVFAKRFSGVQKLIILPLHFRDAMYGRSDPVCPFFAFYSLGEVAETIVPDALIVRIFHHTTMILVTVISVRLSQFF